MTRALHVILTAVVFIGISAHLSTRQARADLSWFNTSTNLAYYADGTTPLFGIKGSNAVSAFVQLIYAGADDTIDPAQYFGTGTTGDDQAVAWSYIGANLPGTAGSTSHYGRVIGGTYTDTIAGGLYFVRTWTAPSDDFANGIVPGSTLTNLYGNSELVQAMAGFEPPNPPQNFNFGGSAGVISSLTPIPEPAVSVLLGIGWLLLVHRRLRGQRKEERS